MRAVVAGAGFAGLAAADTLAAHGVEVEVLEARERVGGRVWSVPFAGAVAERGAEFVLPGYTELAALVERLHLALVRKGTLYGQREPRGAGAVSAQEVTAGVAHVLSGSGPGAGLSLAARLAAAGLRPGVAEAIRARLEVSCTHPADDLEAEVISDGAGSFGAFDSFTVQGGNDTVARALAGALAAGGAQVRTSAPVRGVRWSGGGVRVRAGGTETTADALVLAVPASVLDAIEFDPPLPAGKRAALGAVVYGHAAKLFVALRAPAPPSATLAVPERYWCYTQFGADGRPLPFVAAFAGTWAALQALELERGPARWVRSLAALRPDLELEPDSAMLCTWHDDRWVRGAYSARSLASPLQPSALAAPVGPLHFAGEHTAGPWQGLMEGALRSGRRAAAEILDGRRASG